MALENGMSMGDVLALTKGGNDGLFGGNVGGILAIIIVFILLFGGGGYGWGNNNPNAVTQATLQTGDLYSALVAQDANGNIRSGFSDVLNGQCRINDAILTAQYGDQIAFNNGINSVNTNLNSGFDNVSSAINNLGYQMSQMCCDIKTQMLQDKYETTQNSLNQAQNTISNQAQSAYLLGQLGRYVTNPPIPPIPFGATLA